MKFIQSRAPVRLLTAGNQSGKTTIGAYEAACYALGQHPYKRIRIPNTSFIVTAKPHKEGIEKDLLPKIRQVTGSHDILDVKNNPQGTPFKILWRTGSVSFLMSAEQDDIVFEGTTLDWVWLDEPSRRSIYIAVKRGMLTTGGHLWYTCTPLDEPWLYDEIYLPGISGKSKDIEVFEGSSDENISNIGEDNKRKFISSLSDEEIETRWYGKFRHLSGRVFTSYQPEIHRIPSFDIPSHWPVWGAIDPHRHKPHASLFLACGPKNEFYVCNEIYKKCSIYELGYHFAQLSPQYRMIEQLIDTSAQEEGWGKLSAREMLEVGPPNADTWTPIRTKLAQKKNLKNSGISLINQLFRDNRLFVMEHCIRTHRELTLQTYRKNKFDTQKILEEPEKKWDDMTDCLRYILVERPDFSGAAEIKEYGPAYGRL